ncbi:hypothetical protein [Halobacillus sp. A5]|uniref:hypothetical protein n=1 Tax=Halobacillus sp. A5 TaxID=2880263 RepID=UPI0020A6AA70|nr:hypothetical protein [Halobacillus sp. A5]MCP3028913.1 hypothetical protein [Halobacillus sp. A5]
MGVLIYLAGTAVSLLILYYIIESAVKNGIDKSRLGGIIAKNNGVDLHKQSNTRESWLDDDLDNQ